MLLSPAEVLNLARFALPKIWDKYPVANRYKFCRMMVALCYQESCINKNAPDWRCFDTEAAAGTSSALGLTQVLKDTQRYIESQMGWTARPLTDRKDPQYSLDLGSAYIGYLLKRNGDDWYKTFSSYHDGHYRDGGPGNGYARKVLDHYDMFPWETIEAEANSLLEKASSVLPSWAQWALREAANQAFGKGEFY